MPKGHTILSNICVKKRRVFTPTWQYVIKITKPYYNLHSLLQYGIYIIETMLQSTYNRNVRSMTKQ